MASSKKCISKAAYLRWPENIRKNYEFSFNDSGDKVIHALFIYLLLLFFYIIKKRFSLSLRRAFG